MSQLLCRFCTDGALGIGDFSREQQKTQHREAYEVFHIAKLKPSVELESFR